MTTQEAAAQLLDRLTTDELASIVAEAGAGRREHILKSVGERGRAQELIRQQYSGRYPFELLQNANDAAGSDGSQGGRIAMVVTDDSLIVADQGAGFGTDQVSAICGLGRSSKDPRKSVGYKGLGFKSVGEITERPQVVNGALRFGFDESQARRLIAEAAGGLSDDQKIPVYALPFRLQPQDLDNDLELVEDLLADGYRTLLRLPFKAGVDRTLVSSHLQETVLPRLLLFLDAVDELHLSGTSHDFTAVVVREPHEDHQEVLLDTGSAEERFLVFRKRLEITDRSILDGLGSAWKEVESVGVGVAVPLDNVGAPCGGPPQPLHVYFPTEESTGLPLVLHADFALELDRRHIASTPESVPYNDWLGLELARYSAEVVSALANLHPRSPGVISALAPVDAATGFGSRVRSNIFDLLSEVAFVPCVDGRVRTPAETRLLPGTAPDAARVHAYAYGPWTSRCVVPQLETRPRERHLLRHVLAVPELGLSEVVSEIDPGRAPDPESYYELLIDWAEGAGTRSFAGVLRNLPCVRMIDGAWAKPAGVFFPRKEGDVDLPPELHVPLADVPDLDLLRGLLTAAGVTGFEWRPLLVQAILPLLRDPAAPPEKRDLAMLAVNEYFRTSPGQDAALIQSLSQILVPTVDRRGGNPQLRPAAEAYFGSAWLGDDRLELLLGGSGSSVFLAPNALLLGDPDASLQFYARVGVAARPRLSEIVATGDAHMGGRWSSHPHRRLDPSGWQRWLADQDVQSATVCPQGHPQTQQLYRSSTMEGLTELIERQNWSELDVLFQLLTEHWAEYEPALVSEFRCLHSAHSRVSARTAPSMLAVTLRDCWVPAIQREERVVMEPQRVWRLTRNTPRAVGKAVAALPAHLDQPRVAGLASAIGLVDVARPSVGDLVGLLRDLAADEVPLDLDPDRQSAATWAMENLNNALTSRDRLEDGKVPLFAKQNGRAIFADRPFVATRPTVLKTWGSTHPVLHRGRDLGRLAAALDLTDLDLLEPEVRAIGPDTQRSALVDAQLRAAYPYLYALVTDVSASAAGGAPGRLRNLAVVACEALELVYRLGEVERVVADAMTHLAVRFEGEGRRIRLGTAYVVLRPGGECDWYGLGPLLADHLDIRSQGSAFALLLKASHADRFGYLNSLGIGSEAIEAARTRLSEAIGDDFEFYEPQFVPPPALPVEHTAEPPAASSKGGLLGIGDVNRAGSHPPSSDGAPARDIPALDIDGLVVEQPPPMQMPRPSLESTSPVARTSSGMSGLGPRTQVDWAGAQQVRSDIGARGEEAVYHAERTRVRAFGNPDLVHWVSREHPMADHDIQSVDSDGQRIFIEVKATTGDDPAEWIPISTAELRKAFAEGERYHLYRVLRADSANPTIVDFGNPAELLRRGKAEVQMADAKLRILNLVADTPTVDSSGGSEGE